MVGRTNRTGRRDASPTSPSRPLRDGCDMIPAFPALARRRLASLALVAVLGAVIVAPGAATATVTTLDEAGLTVAEAAMVATLNADRADHGLVAVRIDPRLMAIARARSDDMVANGYFGHVQPDGRNVFDIL